MVIDYPHFTFVEPTYLATENVCVWLSAPAEFTSSSSRLLLHVFSPPAILIVLQQHLPRACTKSVLIYSIITIPTAFASSFKISIQRQT